MKKFISLILSSILVFSFIVFFSIQTQLKDVMASTSTLTIYAEKNKIELTDKTINKLEDKMKLEICIPYLQGFANDEFEKKINEDINIYINNKRAEFENTVEKDLLYAKAKGYSLPRYEFKSSYVVNYSDDKLLSVSVIIDSFTGGNYSNIEKKSYNINLQSEELINLQDLFDEEEDFQQVINNKINEDIAKNNNSYYNNKFNGINYDQEFYLINNYIVVYFQMNDIAPYIFGVPEFKVPFTNFSKTVDLKKITKSNLSRINTEKVMRQNKEVNSTINMPKIHLNNSKISKKINETIEDDIFSFVKSIENESKNKQNNGTNPNSVFVPYNINISYKVLTNSQEKIIIGICKTHFDGSNIKSMDNVISIDVVTGNISIK